MRNLGKWVAASVALALTATSVQARCWDEAAVRAARSRELDTMLMVSALRCRNDGATFLADYNSFVKTSRPALLRINAQLRAHFDEGRGQRATLDAFDNYVTAIANRYGAGSDGLSCSDFGWITKAALGASGSDEDIAQLAENARIEPILPEGRCASVGTGYTLAARR
jgi:hypothetical protein